MISGFEKLIDSVDKKINTLGINPSEIKLDHIGYKASSSEDYENRKKEVENDAQLVHENEVSGRILGIFKFTEPLKYKHHSILGFEIVAPKIEEISNSYWEHVEYVINGNLSEFIKIHSNIEFDQTAINRPEFKKVAIRFDDGLSAKFHLETVLEEIAKNVV